MDAISTIELLKSLGPLATQYGWPAVFAVFFMPKLLALANAHIDLMNTLRVEMPRVRRNQRVAIRAMKSQSAAAEKQTEATTALTRALQEMGQRTAAPTPAV